MNQINDKHLCIKYQQQVIPEIPECFAAFITKNTYNDSKCNSYIVTLKLKL